MAWRSLLTKNPLQPFAERTEQSSDGPLCPLLQVTRVHGAQTRRNLIAVLEVLDVGRAAFNRPMVGDQAQLLCTQIGGPRERFRRHPPR